MLDQLPQRPPKTGALRKYHPEAHRPLAKLRVSQAPVFVREPLHRILPFGLRLVTGLALLIVGIAIAVASPGYARRHYEGRSALNVRR